MASNVVFLICIVAGYFVIVESRNYAIKDSYNRNPDTIGKKKLYSSAEIPEWLKNYLNDEKISRNKKNQNVIEALVAKVINKEKERRKLDAERNLRSGIEVHNFLHKLNHFINENTQRNNYYKKRVDCKFGFGNPSKVCKSPKFRRHFGEPKNGHNPKKYYNYAQGMYVERAGSSSSSSDEQSAKPKYRFQVVKRKKQKTRENSESEESSEDSDDSDDKTDHKSYSDKNSNEDITDITPIKTKHMNLDEDSNEYERKQNKKPESEESAKTSEVSSMEGKDVKYLYLQGTRLQEPAVRSGRWKSGRRGDRLPYFMPKRHKWDSHLFHHIDTFWENINVADTYNLNKYKSW